MFLAHDLEPEQNRQIARKQKARMLAGSRPEEIDRRRDVGEAEDEERHRLAQADKLQQDHRRERSDDHADVAQRVDGGDDARAPIDARPGLNRGEERDDVKAQGC